MKSMFRVLCSVLVVALQFSCTQQLAGNGSEITNGYCIASALPADSAIVVAYPNDYLPYPPSGKPETTFTDKNGHFTLCLGRKGWNLVIYDRLQVFGAFVPLPRGDSAVDTVVLRGLGAITAIINDTTTIPRIVGIIGSPFYARITGKADTFSITKIPAFYYNLSKWQWLAITTGTMDGNVLPITNIGLKGGSATITVQPDSTTNITIYP